MLDTYYTIYGPCFVICIYHGHVLSFHQVRSFGCFYFFFLSGHNDQQQFGNNKILLLKLFATEIDRSGCGIAPLLCYYFTIAFFYKYVLLNYQLMLVQSDWLCAGLVVVYVYYRHGI